MPAAQCPCIDVQTHLLYLAMDNSLQDCTELPTGDVSDTEIVQDYKKLSKRNQANSKVRLTLHIVVPHYILWCHIAYCGATLPPPECCYIYIADRNIAKGFFQCFTVHFSIQ